MNNQKNLSKKYSHLNGREITCYIGRVPCNFKHVEYELSVVKKENEYGLFEVIAIRILKTHFNGKVLKITPHPIDMFGIIQDFVICEDQISLLSFI